MSGSRSAATGAVRWFITSNARIANLLEKGLPRGLTRNLRARHEELIAKDIMAGARTALDVGAGHLCPYAAGRPSSTLLIGMDILPEQLARNRDIDRAIVADASGCWPVRDESMDLIVSRTTLEHLRNTSRFFEEVHRVLRPGGRCHTFVPGRYAPFAILNRKLPPRLSHFMLNTLYSVPTDECGFTAYYDGCYYPRLSRLAEKAGLTVDTCDVRYYQSSYYKGVLPVWAASVAYDMVLWAINARPLAAQMLLVVSKPGVAAGGAGVDPFVQSGKGGDPLPEEPGGAVPV